MPNWITEEFRSKNARLWKNKRVTDKLALNFAGRILTLPTPEVVTERLKKISERLVAAKTETPNPLDNQNLPQGVVPTEDDFISVEYRALTAAMLSDRAIDFSNQPMLKRAVALLDGQTVYKDHETCVDNFVGRVNGTRWDDSTKDLPPGINAILKLDAVKEPMIVRGVLQGALHSVSVTVSFEWKPSHPKLMDEHNFWNNLGLEVDGEVVRIVVTSIEQFFEISLVWQGADQYAKQIGPDGEVVHMAAKQASLAHAGGTNHKQEKRMDFLELLKKSLGLSDTVTLTEDNALGYIEKFRLDAEVAEREKAKSNLTQLTKIHSEEIAKLTTQVETLSKQITDDKSSVELGKKYLEDERSEAKRMCKLAKGANVSPAILSALDKSDLELVQAFKAEFTKEYEDKVPLRCNSCQSKAVSRQSSVTDKTITPESEAPAGLSPEASAKLNSLHS